MAATPKVSGSGWVTVVKKPTGVPSTMMESTPELCAPEGIRTTGRECDQARYEFSCRLGGGVGKPDRCDRCSQNCRQLTSRTSFSPPRFAITILQAGGLMTRRPTAPGQRLQVDDKVVWGTCGQPDQFGIAAAVAFDVGAVSDSGQRHTAASAAAWAADSIAAARLSKSSGIRSA